jgi:hypothetical protein
MKARSLASLVALFLGVVGFVAGLWWNKQRIATERQAEELKARAKDLVTRVATAERQQKAQEALRTSVADTASVTAPKPARAPFTPAPAFLNNPQLVEEATKAHYSVRLESFFRRMGATEAQKEHLLSSFAHGNYSFITLESLERMSVSNPELGVKMLADVLPEMGKIAATVLGPDSANEFVEAILLKELQEAANGVALAVFHTDTPLSHEGVQAIVKLLNESSPPRNLIPARLDYVDWDLARQKAQKMLTPAQMAGFEAVRLRHAFNTEVSRAGGSPSLRLQGL